MSFNFKITREKAPIYTMTPRDPYATWLADLYSGFVERIPSMTERNRWAKVLWKDQAWLRGQRGRLGSW